MRTVRVDGAAAAGPLGHVRFRARFVAQRSQVSLSGDSAASARRGPLSSREYLLFFLRCPGLIAAHESRAASNGSGTRDMFRETLRVQSLFTRRRSVVYIRQAQL